MAEHSLATASNTLSHNESGRTAHYRYASYQEDLESNKRSLQVQESHPYAGTTTISTDQRAQAPSASLRYGEDGGSP